MTVDEYREEVLRKINNADDRSEVDAVISEARRVIDGSTLTPVTVRQFWADLYEAVKSGRGRRFLRESQAAVSLNALIQHALASIANLSAFYASKP